MASHVVISSPIGSRGRFARWSQYAAAVGLVLFLGSAAALAADGVDIEA